MDSDNIAYFHQKTHLHLTDETFPELITKQSNKLKEKEAYVFRYEDGTRHSLSFNELHKRTEDIAQGLLCLGLHLGDAVAIIGPTCPEWVLSEYACMKAGVVSIRMKIEMLNRPQQLKNILHNYQCKSLIFHPGFDGKYLKAIRKIIPFDADHNLAKSVELPHLEYVMSMTKCELTSLENIDEILKMNKNDDSLEKGLPEISHNSIATVFLTSGSTGLPKAVALSHFNMINEYKTTPGKITEEDDRIFNDRAFSWVGCYSALPLVLGCTMVYIPSHESGKIKFLLDVLKTENCNSGVLLPYLLYDLIGYFQENNNEKLSLKWAGTGGEQVPEYLFRKASEFVDKMFIIYGSTEGATVLESNVNDPPEKKASITGQVTPHVEIKIVEEDRKSILQLHQVGEICIRSPFTFHSYYNDPEMTRDIKDKDGWVYMGDAGIMLEDGYVKVLGRKKDLISRATLKYMPITFEKCLAEHKAVDRVCVVGIPEPRLFEEVCACVVLTKDSGQITEAELLDFCKSKEVHTSDGQGCVPDHILVLDSFPIVNGKVDRVKLKEIATKRLEKCKD